MERGRTSEFPDEAAEAFDGLDDAFRDLLAAFAGHPSLRLDAAALAAMAFGALRTVLEERGFAELGALNALASITPEDLERAFELLRAYFPYTPQGRPYPDWRHITITMLRDVGVSQPDAEEMADTARLTATKPQTVPIGREARQRRRERARRRRAKKSHQK